MFKINIHNLKEGEQSYEFTAGSDDFDFSDTEFEIPEDIKIDIVLYKVDSQISVKVFLKGKFKYLCDRCLEDFTDNFETEFDIIYKFEFNGENLENENDDEIKFISPSTIFLDLKDDLRDFILLSVPLRKAPEEVDGNCTFCKKNINEMLNISKQEEVNPVWEKLIKAKTK